MDDAENLRDLGVRFVGCNADAAECILGEFGRLEGDYVWLDIKRLKDLSPLASDSEWAHGFDGAIDFARTKGWIDESGTQVRAHIS
jgi:hypothetical protein